MRRLSIVVVSCLATGIAQSAPVRSARPARPADHAYHIDAAAEGNAGVEALQRGDNDEAIRRFGLALQSGDLKGDDIEFAYANRGKAYLNKGALSSAIVDLDRARQMKPDDVDAQTDLATAIAKIVPAESMPGLPKASFLSKLGTAVLQGAAAGLIDANAPPPQ